MRCIFEPVKMKDQSLLKRVPSFFFGMMRVIRMNNVELGNVGITAETYLFC